MSVTERKALRIEYVRLFVFPDVSGKYGTERDYVGNHLSGCGRRETVEVHRRGDKPVEKGHDRARRDRDQKPFRRKFPFSCPGHPVCQTVHDDRRSDERHAKENEQRIAFGRTEIIDQYAQNQRQSHSDGKSHGHAAKRHGRRKQDVRRIENAPAEKSREKQQNYHIVPIEKFVAPRLCGKFLGIPPRTSTTHRQGLRKRLRPQRRIRGISVPRSCPAVRLRQSASCTSSDRRRNIRF